MTKVDLVFEVEVLFEGEVEGIKEYFIKVICNVESVNDLFKGLNLGNDFKIKRVGVQNAEAIQEPTEIDFKESE